jgi:hypothetical protein
METFQPVVAIWRAAGAGLLVLAAAALLAPAGGARAAGEQGSCPPPGDERIVIATVETWRTLITQDGRRITPAAIADFGTIAPQSAQMQAAAESALGDALRNLARKPLGVRYLSDRPDRRGRRPVLLYAGETLLQRDLIGKGLAIAYPTDGDLPCAGRLLDAEGDARAQKRGYWARGTGWVAGARPEDFATRLNRFVILQARVISVGTRKDRSYLNFGGRWSDDVTVEIPDASRDAFGGPEAVEALDGQRVRVRGFAVWKSGPMIEVRRPWQIEILTKRAN